MMEKKHLFYIKNSTLFINDIITDLLKIESIWEPSKKSTRKGFQTPNNIVTCYQKFTLNLHFHAFTVFLVQCEFCCAEVIYFRKETPGNGTVFVVVERITENLCSSISFSKKE